MGKNNRGGLSRRQQQQQRRGQMQSAANKPKAKFMGLSQGAMKGIVICDSITDTSLAQQFNTFYEALIRVAGSTEKCGAMLKTSIKKSRMLTKEDDFYPEEPHESEYQDKDGATDDIKKQAKYTAWINACSAQDKPHLTHMNAMDNPLNAIIGQLGPAIMSALEAIDDWEVIDEENRAIDLIKHVKEICYRGDVKKTDIGMDIIRKTKEMMNHKQDNSWMTTLDHADSASNKMDVLKSKGIIIMSPALVKCTLKNRFDDGITYEQHCECWSSSTESDIKKKEKIDDAMREILLSRIIIEGLDKDACRGLPSEMEDEHARGAHREVDNHTNTIAATVALANQHHVKIPRKQGNNRPNNQSNNSNNRNPDENKNHPEQNAKDTSPDSGSETKPGGKVSSGEALQLLMRGGKEEADADDEFMLLQRCITDDAVSRTHYQHLASSMPCINNNTTNNTPNSNDINIILRNDFRIARNSSHVSSSNVSMKTDLLRHESTGCNSKPNFSTRAAQHPVDIYESDDSIHRENDLSQSKEIERFAENTAARSVELVPSCGLPVTTENSNYDRSIESNGHKSVTCTVSNGDVAMGFQAANPPLSHEKMHHRNACLFSQSIGRDVNPWWLLLDSQASINVMVNPRMVTNVRKHPEGSTVRLHCNAGWKDIDTMADMKGCGVVWFCPEGIANCLSLARVSDTHRITLDTSIDQAFHLHRDDGTTRRFERTACNLHACDASRKEAVAPIITVEGKKKNHSDLDVRRATAARKLQETIGFPSTAEFLKMVDNNAMKNCAVTRRDIKMGEDIFGPNPNMMKGKTVWRKPTHVSEEILPVPPDILKRHKNVALSVDVFCINGIPFLRTMSRHLMHRSSIGMGNVRQETLMKNLLKIVNQHGLRGFKVKQTHGDNQFTCLGDELSKPPHKITFHPVARGSHEPFIERDNRTNKERCRCTCATLQFKWIPKRMMLEMPPANDFWLNCWCSSGGASDTVPPRQILTGTQLDAKKHCRFQFGECMLAHEETDNTMKERALDSICLRPTGTPDGAFCALNIATGQRVRRRSATAAHMTPAAIKQVEDLAKSEGMPEGLKLEDRDKMTILDLETEHGEGIDDDSQASDESYDSKDDDSVMTDLTGVVSEDDNDEAGDPMENQIDRTSEHQAHKEDANTQSEDVETQEHDGVEPVENEEYDDPSEDDDQEIEDRHEPTDEDDMEQTTNVDNEDEEEDEDGDVTIDFTGDEGYEINDDATDMSHPEMEDASPARRSLRESVRRMNAKTFEPVTHERNFFTAGFGKAIRNPEQQSDVHCFIQTAVDAHNNIDASLVTPQCGAEKGLKIFKEEGAAAVLKELIQMKEFNVVTPKHARDLTEEEIRNALPCPMFLKRKRCGKIKGRGCADGRAQREFISKDEASSPTASLHAIILTSIIDAIENRYTVVTDVPGAFLQTEMPEDEDPVHIKFTGSVVDLLERLDPELYSKCIVTTKKGRRILCAKANEATCGTLKAALLFWKKLKGALEDEMGFKQNPYDQCAMNKIVDGSQATIAWHVDDLKISHAKKEVVESIINDLNSRFGGKTGLSTSTGKVHDYLGMTIDCSRDNMVMISMCDYLEDILATMPDDLKTNRSCVTPAADHLFEANENATKLDRKEADTFHRIVAKLPFAAKRARPDVQTAVAFLCTRVQSPDTDDWKKLSRVLGYLKETIFLPLTLGWDETGNTHWHVDASFAVHQNMRSHTGAVMTFGRGAALSMSTKQKLNTKSSTEAELVGVDDALPLNIWCMHFLKAQGFHANQRTKDDEDASGLRHLGHRNVLHQDNTSSIRLELNGEASSAKRTRHFNVRLFLIADKVKQKETNDTIHCPTEEMIADALTKPLQGSLFRKFRNAIMGCTDADYIRYKAEYEKRKSERSSAQ